MYYALTINADQIITGVHESVTPILTDTFSANPELADDTVVTIPTPADYQTYTHILCYEDDGTLKDPVWCIQQGYMPMPDGHEIVDGVLVETSAPIEGAPVSIKQFIADEVQGAKAASDAKLNALAPLVRDLMVGKPAEVVIPLIDFMPPWKEGKWAVGQSCLYADYPYVTAQAHDSTGNPSWNPQAAPALFSPWHGKSRETALPFRPVTGAHDMYKKGEWMLWIDGVAHEALSDTNYSPTDYPKAWRAHPNV